MGWIVVARKCWCRELVYAMWQADLEVIRSGPLYGSNRVSNLKAMILPNFDVDCFKLYFRKWNIVCLEKIKLWLKLTNLVETRLTRSSGNTSVSSKELLSGKKEVHSELKILSPHFNGRNSSLRFDFDVLF